MRRYMVVEHFKDVRAVYRRFGERSRIMPGGLVYISSWIDEKVERCFQLMEAPDRALLDEWMSHWTDLMDFEVYAVITSEEAAQKVTD